MSDYKDLKVGDRVDRDDGRFYIPVKSLYGEGPIVLRVASDAFENSEEDAVFFAEALVNRWNHIEGWELK